MRERKHGFTWFGSLGILLALTGALVNGRQPLAYAAVQADDLVTFIGTLGGTESRALGINSLGHIVGWASLENGKQHAFLWDGAALRDLGVLASANESVAYAINDAGQIAGASSSLGDITPRAFRWQNGTLTDIGAFTPRAINKNGDVAGTLPIKRNGLDWFEHACLWRNGTLTDLGTLGGNNSYAYAINDAGFVAGVSQVQDDLRTKAFLWSNGTLSDLGALGGNSSQALALSNTNQVAGVSDTASGAPHSTLFALNATGGVASRTDLGALDSSYSYAYAVNGKGQTVGTNGHALLWQNGTAFDLNSLLPANSDWVLQNAAAINDNGQIAGWGTFQGSTYAFALRPIANAWTASVSAASYDGTKLAPESICAAFGVNLSAATAGTISATLPITLAGTSVTVRDSAGRLWPAPLFFVSPNQINYLIPAEAANGPATLIVSNRANVLTLGTINLAKVAPGVFSADASGRGLAAALALRVKADGSQTYESVVRFDPVQNKFVAVPIDLGPASDQVFLILYGTGWRNRSSQSAVMVKVGNADAPVSFAGAQGSLTGLDQINVLLPKALAGRGEVEVSLIADGQTANPVRVSIR
ncbi:MAG: hypothetical protein HYR56_33975 [Acidobacteria bacterium]|nr:hypothetical protein [Acidobacteriota bacterium]MBI3427755.1 hypothetical protein [Acidobacteriota bacterium]